MKKLIIVFTTLVTAVVAAPPEVSNVRASQREGTKLVDIWYDAADVDNDLLKVRVQISSNAGMNYNVPALTFAGDFGDSVSPGQNKHIVWDAGNDWDGEYSDQMRVKITVTDVKGFPGLEWGNEVPPGGFLLGQDGGAEGSGPAKQVNIPWSFWLSKYEITASQYCEFLNTALACGKIKRSGNCVYSIVGINLINNVSGEYLLCELGDEQKIRWNVMRFEVVGSYSNYPASTTFYGAMAWANFYGYDLPTFAEWEKCARGDNGEFGQHQLYTWGNDRSYNKAFYYVFPDNRIGTNIGSFSSCAYGCYDMTGNTPEWNRSCVLSRDVNYNYFIETEDYPSIETLDNKRHKYWERARPIYRDGHPIYGYGSAEKDGNFVLGIGFRVCRRFIQER